MTLTTADISILLLMDVSNGLSEIQERLTPLTFSAVHNPTQGPEVRQVLDESLAVMDRTSSEGLIWIALWWNFR